MKPKRTNQQIFYGYIDPEAEQTDEEESEEAVENTLEEPEKEQE